MSDAAQPNKVVVFLKLVPMWLWLTTTISLSVFAGFLYYLSQQVPDQYAMTQHPPWQHTMNHSELIAYHRAMKAGLYDGSELEAKNFLYRQGAARQLLAANGTNRPRALNRGTPGRSLSFNEASGFASRSEPVNQYSLRHAQQSIAIERNHQGMINTSQVASKIPAGIYVQTASLRSINDADVLRQNLQAKGFTPFIQEAFVKNQRWYRVRFGPYPSVADARRAARDLESRRYSAQVVHAK